MAAFYNLLLRKYCFFLHGVIQFLLLAKLQRYFIGVAKDYSHDMEQNRTSTILLQSKVRGERYKEKLKFFFFLRYKSQDISGFEESER